MKRCFTVFYIVEPIGVLAQLLLYKETSAIGTGLNTADDLMQKRCNLFHIQKQLFVVAAKQIHSYIIIHTDRHTHTHSHTHTQKLRPNGTLSGAWAWGASMCLCMCVCRHSPSCQALALCYANTPCVLSNRLLPAGKVIYTEVAIVHVLFGVVSTHEGGLNFSCLPVKFTPDGTSAR